MGCYPVAAAATAYHRENDAHKIRHDGKGQFDALGDRWRNWPLVPDQLKLNLEQSADLDIRRALRGGIDGFAVDAWAGGQGAKDVLDALFQVAEQKDYPFELTICLDNAGPGDTGTCWRSMARARSWAGATASRWSSVTTLSSSVSPGRWRRWASGQPTTAETWKSPALLHPGGLEANGRGFSRGSGGGRPARLRALQPGRPLPSGAGRRGKRSFRRPALWSNTPARWASSRAAARFTDEMAEAVRTAGAEYCQPMWFQYDNTNWGGFRTSQGSKLFRDSSRTPAITIRRSSSSSPGTTTPRTPASRRLTTRATPSSTSTPTSSGGGSRPTARPDHDRVYLLYRKYQKGAKILPFYRAAGYGRRSGSAHHPDQSSQGACAGTRGDTKRRPAYPQLFPLTPGPVTAESCATESVCSSTAPSRSPTGPSASRTR